MSDINILSSILNPTERSGFIQYLDKRNKRKEASNIHLYKAFLTGKEEKLKEKWGFNLFNVTKKRVTDRLLDYVAGQTVESDVSSEISIIKQIVVARKLLAYGEMKLAFKILKQSEKQAEQIQHYSLLNEIYHTLIEYSYHDLAPGQESVYQKFQLNHQRFLSQERLNMVYASLNKAFIAAEHKREELDFSLLVETTKDKYGLADDELFNFRTLFQLAQLSDLSGAYSRSYHNVDLYFESSISDLQGGPLDSEKDLPYHIDLLYFMANIYFRKKSFDKSAAYLEEMHKQMLRFDHRYYFSRIAKYTTLKALNLNYNGLSDKAAYELDRLMANKKVDRDALLNSRLARIMIHFQQGELKEASSALAKLNHTDSYYEQRAGLEWLLHKKYMEILLHIELGNEDYVDSRITSLVRSHSQHLKKSQHARVLPFLKLVRKYCQHPEIVTTSEFKNMVEAGVNWKPNEEEDIFFMSFYAWLKAKMLKQPLYETTLELVNQS